VTKASATLFCRHTAQSRRVHLPTLRLYSVYGPYEESTRLVPTLVVRGLRGELPPLVNPDVARDFVYTEDVNDAFVLAATAPGQESGAVYNLGTGVQTSLRDAVDVARRVLGVAAEARWGTMPDRRWDTTVWVADNRKACDELGWRPRHTFEQGLRQLVGWFRENPSLLGLYQRRVREPA
jgi:dolichol-phosphate mannosyltransferase